MLIELEKFNGVRRESGSVEIDIGIYTGTLVPGTIGERQRLETTVISDAVNIASRLESLTKTMGARIIISSRETASACPTKRPARTILWAGLKSKARSGSWTSFR